MINNFLLVLYYTLLNKFTAPTFIHSQKKEENRRGDKRFLFYPVTSRDHMIK